MPAKVAFLTPLALHADMRTLKQARSLADAGYEVVVIHAGGGAGGLAPQPFRAIGLADEAAAPTGPASAKAGKRALLKRWMPRFLWDALAFLWFLADCHLTKPKAVTRHLAGADLVYLHEYRLYQAARALARATDAPIIYDAHDFYPLVHAEAELTPFWRHVALPVLGWMERRCVRGAAATVTVADNIAALFAARYGTRPVVLRNSHSARLEAPPATGLRERLGLEAGHFVVAVVGNRKPGQAVDALVRALALLPERVHAVFVGRGYDDHSGLAAELGVAARVHAVGALPADQVVPFLRGADCSAILYFPLTENYRRCLPNGFFQSCAAGLPLVYPALPEIAALADPAGLGVKVDPQDPAALARAVAGLAEDPEACRAHRDNQARAQAELSWSNDEAVLVELAGRLTTRRAG